MKKSIAAVLLILIFVILSLMSFAVTKVAASSLIESMPLQKARFILPSSLERIDEEAFEGTAATTVVFPDGLLSIGAGVFKNAYGLTDVYIPGTTTYIADSAFPTASNLTVHGVDGSYAKDWAREHEIPFVVEDIWKAIVQTGRLSSAHTNPINRYIATIIFIIIFALFRYCYYETRSRRPQDRPELNPIDYQFP